MLTKKQATKSRKPIYTIILGCSAAVFVVSFLTGSLQYATGYLQCGTRPLIIQPGSTFAGGSGRDKIFTTDDNFLYKYNISSYYRCSVEQALEVADPGFNGNPDYDNYAIDWCGGEMKQVVAHIPSMTYLLPQDESYKIPAEESHYFCKEYQAKASGFTHHTGER